MAEKTNMWCRSCKKYTPCPVIESRGLWQSSKSDLRYRERRRECDVCQSTFSTVEIDKWDLASLQQAVFQYEQLIDEWQNVENSGIERSTLSLAWLSERREYLRWTLDKDSKLNLGSEVNLLQDFVGDGQQESED